MKKEYIPLGILGLLLILGTFKCPIYGIIGLPCPTCGMTRAWRLLLIGDLAGAFRMHPLFLLPAVFLIPKCRTNKVIIAALVLLVLVWLVRLVLFFPSDAPMNINPNSILGVIT